MVGKNYEFMTISHHFNKYENCCKKGCITNIIDQVR